jgi:RNA polymerase sigma factor (TIGR02999 family)
VTAAGEVTLLLREIRAGNREAFDRLVPLVYAELRGLARAHLRRRGGGRTLDTTGLVHEAWIKMAGQDGIDVRDRGHFLAVSAHAMRQVLVDLARARSAAKRRPAGERVTFDENVAAGDLEVEAMLDLDRALERLRAHDERLGRVVECRYFAGLSEEETAEALGVSLRTAQRDWLRARAWLREELSS